MASLSQDGELLASPPCSPGELLLRLPLGAYTAARTRGRSFVVAWPTHRHRILSSLALLRGGDAAACDEAEVLARVACSARCALRAAPPGDALLLLLHVAVDTLVATVQCTPLPPWPAALPPPRPVLALAPPRPPPFAAKSSVWASQRGPLQAARPPDCCEVVTLSFHSGAGADVPPCLIEGVLTSFFVATRCGELHTASVEDGALPGVARGVVLAAAERGGCAVRAAAPAFADRAAWAEAFIVNAIRGVTPVSAIRWGGNDLDVGGGGNTSARDGAFHEKVLPLAPGPATVAAAAALRAWHDETVAPDAGDDGWRG